MKTEISLFQDFLYLRITLESPSILNWINSSKIDEASLSAFFIGFETKKSRGLFKYFDVGFRKKENKRD